MFCNDCLDYKDKSKSKIIIHPKYHLNIQIANKIIFPTNPHNSNDCLLTLSQHK